MKIRETKIKNFKFITLIVILFSISCGNNSKNLETKLNEYKKTYENGDYVKMSSFVLPGLIEQFGGTENFVNTMNSLPELFLGMGMEVDMKKMKFSMVELSKKNSHTL
jgi:alpha-L-arabinofuranosidase